MALAENNSLHRYHLRNVGKDSSGYRDDITATLESGRHADARR